MSSPPERSERSRDATGRKRRRGRGADDRPATTAARRRPRRERPAEPEPAKERARPAPEPSEFDSAAAITVTPITGGEFDSGVAIEVEPIRRGRGEKKADKKPKPKAAPAADEGAPAATPLKAGSEEILFGKIALDCGYVDRKAIDHCVALQKSLEGKKSFLGEILLAEGFLDRDEVNEIIALQNKNLRKRYSFTGQPKENTLFGALIVAHGYATREQVNEVVRLQAEIERFDENLSLGELMVECGYLRESEVKEILALQKKREYRCYKCREVFTISLYEFGQKIRCPHCRKVLLLPETPESKKVKLAQSERPEPVDSSGSKDRPVAIDEVEPLEDSSLTDILGDPPPASQPSGPPAEIEKATGWYVGLGGKIFGPQKLDALRKLISIEIFHRHDLFWHESMEDWQLAGDIPEIATLFPKPPPLPAGAPGRPPSVEKDADLASLLDRIEALKTKGSLGEAEYRDIRRILLGD